mmetsp:Transcript_27979/g.79075  ORF Transcript_27979/g.79075 Transcript_27979/m.79075 type:complete len:718 (+) Transcript_27979:131-2284(+)
MNLLMMAGRALSRLIVKLLFWSFVKVLPAFFLGWLVWYLRTGGVDVAAFWRELTLVQYSDLLKALIGPMIAFCIFMALQPKPPAENSVTEKAHDTGFLNIRSGEWWHDAKMFVIIVVLPGLGYVNWDLEKRALAQSGPAINATLSALLSAMGFIKSMASLMLMPLLAAVTSANQANDPARALQVIGAGLSIGLVIGMFTQVMTLVFATEVIGLFEGVDPLLPDASLLFFIYTMSFTLLILGDAIAAIMAAFGPRGHLKIGECMFIPECINLTGTLIFACGGRRVLVVVVKWVIMAIVAVSIMVYKLWDFIAELQEDVIKNGSAKKDLPVADSGNDSRVSLLAKRVTPVNRLGMLKPSEKILYGMIAAAGNSGIRNICLRFKDFLCSMYATRLGVVAGSVFSMQFTLRAFLAGPAGALGLGATNLGAYLMETKSYGLIVLSIKRMEVMFILFALLWCLGNAAPGPEYVVEYGGQAVHAKHDYLNVLTGLNHWVWAAATVANECGGALDGWLTAMGTQSAYNILGAIYGFDFFVVLLPMLYYTQRHAGTEGCAWPWLAGWEGCNSYTGIMLAMLAWGVVRMTLLLLAFSISIIPKLRRMTAHHEQKCSKDTILVYLRMRTNVPQEERQRLLEEISQKAAFERGWHRYRAGGPFMTYCAEQDVSIEVFVKQLEDYLKAGDEEVKTVLNHAWFTWEQRAHPPLHVDKGFWDLGHKLCGDWM